MLIECRKGKLIEDRMMRLAELESKKMNLKGMRLPQQMLKLLIVIQSN